MSQEDVEIVRQCADALNRRDLPQLFQLLDPQVEIDLSRNIFNPDIYRGHSGVERWRDVIEDVWDDFHGTVDEVVDVRGDHVVVAATIQGTGKQSGVEVQMHLFSIWTVRESRVIRVVGGYRSRSEVMEAAFA